MASFNGADTAKLRLYLINTVALARCVPTEMSAFGRFNGFFSTGKPLKRLQTTLFPHGHRAKALVITHIFWRLVLAFLIGR
jgi:hypothetical protein